MAGSHRFSLGRGTKVKPLSKIEGGRDPWCPTLEAEGKTPRHAGYCWKGRWNAQYPLGRGLGFKVKYQGAIKREKQGAGRTAKGSWGPAL